MVTKIAAAMDDLLGQVLLEQSCLHLKWSKSWTAYAQFSAAAMVENFQLTVAGLKLRSVGSARLRADHLASASHLI